MNVYEVVNCVVWSFLGRSGIYIHVRVYAIDLGRELTLKRKFRGDGISVSGFRQFGLHLS